MKNINILLFASMLSLCFATACKKEKSKQQPVADFIYSGNNIPAPCTVTFNNISTNASSYTWDFGDNSTSSQRSPQHTYTMGGVYTVKLTATGEGGSNTISKTVNIQNAPTKCFIKSVTLNAMPFTDGAGAGWDPFDGPDVFIQIKNDAGTILFDATSARKENIGSTNLPIKWNIATPLEISPLNVRSNIYLYDYDSFDPNDLIGGVGFFPSSFTPGYPNTATVTFQGVTFVLELQWQ